MWKQVLRKEQSPKDSDQTAQSHGSKSTQQHIQYGKTEYNIYCDPALAPSSQTNGLQNRCSYLQGSFHSTTAYVYNLISYYQPSRVLLCSSQLLLEVPRTKTEFGRRAFSYASPQIWKDIPLPIRYSPSLDSFKQTPPQNFFSHAHNRSARGHLATLRTSDLSLS